MSTSFLHRSLHLSGSRSGGLIAQCWASLVSVGEEGFLKHTKEIMEATRFITKGVEKIPGLKLVGSCEAMIVCFTGDVPPVGGIYFFPVSHMSTLLISCFIAIFSMFLLRENSINDLNFVISYNFFGILPLS